MSDFVEEEEPKQAKMNYLTEMLMHKDEAISQLLQEIENIKSNYTREPVLPKLFLGKDIRPPPPKLIEDYLKFDEELSFKSKRPLG